MKTSTLRVLICALGLCCLVLGCAANSPSPSPASSAGLERLDFRQVVADAKDKVFPAVVFIRCIQEDMRTPARSSRRRSPAAASSSRPPARLLTNWHVVDKAVEVRCLLYDGRAMNAKVVGSDKDTDLALLQLDVPPGSPKLPFAESGRFDQAQRGRLRDGHGRAVGPEPLGVDGHHLLHAALPADQQRVQPVAPDRRLHQPGQLRRAAGQHGRARSSASTPAGSPPAATSALPSPRRPSP